MVEETSVQGLLERIRYNERGYSAVEGAIARAIVSDPRSATGASIDAFAAVVGVSAGSVVRFAKRLGLSGYRDLRLALAGEVAAGASSRQGEWSHPLQQTLEMQVRALRLAMETVDPAAFDTAADLLRSSGGIDIVGVGAARSAAQSALFELSTLGLRCRLLADPSEAAAAAGFLGSGDALLAVSHSGRTREVVDAARRARAGGASVVAVTSSPRSPLAKSATATLAIDAGKTRYGGDEMPFRVAHVGMVLALARALAGRMDPSELARRQARWAEARFQMRYDGNATGT